MKKGINRLFVLTFVVGIAIMICSFDRGNGHLIHSEKPVSMFEKIDNSSSADVCFHVGDEYRVVVTIDENLEKYVEIFTKDNILHIRTKNGSYSFTKLLVDIYCPILTGISISGSGDFESKDIITVPTFKTTLSGSGDFKGSVECENFSATLSGSGDMTITGSSKEANIVLLGSGDLKGSIECENFFATLSGSGDMRITGNCKDANVVLLGFGDFMGGKFNINNADVSISRSGDATVWVTENLTAKISGSGDIYCHGKPRIESTVTGFGQIKKK